jgi:hypothetical protein
LEQADIAEAEIRAVLPEARIGGERKTIQVYKKGSQGHQMARMGLHMYYEGQEKDIEDIKVTSVTAEALGGMFRRAWYYWVCSAKNHISSIPATKAVELNRVWGEKIRFNGFAGGTDADGPGNHYHVDTVDGLQALMAAIKNRVR